jgi:hypothetical protein
MGHRQQMTDKERLDWDIAQYNARKEANRGHSYAYMDNALYHELESKGYKEYIFDNGDRVNQSEYMAKKVVDELRADGNYARIICVQNKVRTRQYSIYYKKRSGKKNLAV